jgi:hypothetical protein
VAVALVGLAIAAPASAATQIGQTFPAEQTCDSITWLQSGSPGGQYAAPFAGVITSWSFHAHTVYGPELTFKVARHAGGNDFTIVGEEGPRTTTPGMLTTYPARISVQAGDVIGFRIVSGGPVCARYALGYSAHKRVADPSPGTTATFTPDDTPSGFQLSVSAVLEPDCDNDGFGDETQDPEPVGPACPQPPPKADRTLTLNAGNNKVKRGKKVLLLGDLDSIEQACESGQTVELRRKRPQQGAFTTFAQLQTDAEGDFSTKEKVKKTFEYRAQVPETATCGAQVSNTEEVKVKKNK